jgi:hypothetical protein
MEIVINDPEDKRIWMELAINSQGDQISILKGKIEPIVKTFSTNTTCFLSADDPLIAEKDLKEELSNTFVKVGKAEWYEREEKMTAKERLTRLVDMMMINLKSPLFACSKYNSIDPDHVKDYIEGLKNHIQVDVKVSNDCMALARAKWAERAQAIKRVNDLSPKKMRFSFNILKTD